MTGFSSPLLIAATTVALLCTAWCRQPLMKAPNGAIKTGSFIVILKEASDLNDVIDKIKQFSDKALVQRYTDIVEKSITVSAARNVIEKIREFPEVRHVEEEDLAYGSQGLDEDFQWFLEQLEEPDKSKEEETVDMSVLDSSVGNENTLWFLEHLNKPDNSKEEETVDVYVLDSGIQFKHSEFENRAKYAGYDPVDQSNIGTTNYKPQRGRDCNGHGTLVASLIGGKTYGVAKNVNLFSVRVLGCNRAAPWSIVLDGLNFIASEVVGRKRPAIVSMALSGSRHLSIDLAIRALHTKNILVVASAGNSHSDACQNTPSSNSQVLTVGAVDENNMIYQESNYGSCVDVFAPGASITGAEHSCPTCIVDDASGTSFAAALVCGIAAAQLSRSPLIGPTELKRKVIDVSSAGLIDFSSIPRNFRATTPNKLARLDCGGVLTASSSPKVLQTPNFPRNYPNSLECTWTITAESEELVEIVFEFIKLEDSYDSLTISSASAVTNISGDYGEVSCGYKSSSDFLTLQLHTDETISSTGFRATYRSVDKTTATVLVTDCIKPQSNNILQLDLLSEGAYAGNRFSMRKDWEEFFGGRRQGINLAVLHEDSGEVAFLKTFDTHSSSQASLELAKTIENIDPGALVSVSTSGQVKPYSRLDARTKRALGTLGTSQAPNLQTTSTWALVGVKGLQPNRAIESISTSSSVDISMQVKLQPYRKFGLPISVKSAGTALGNYAKIVVDGTEIELQNEIGSTIGLNVVVIDEQSGRVLARRLFDTHSQAVADTSPSHDFVDFIDTLPTGRVVAIAIKGDAIARLSENAKRACESLGSRYIRQVQVGGSWAIVGRKGASVGTVPESASNCANAQALYYLPAKSHTSKLCQISATTSGFVKDAAGNQCYLGGVSSHISVGNQVRATASRGISLAVVDEITCSISRLQAFDTHLLASASQELVSFLDGVPLGLIVVATAWDEAFRQLSENAKIALESLGGALIRNVNYRDAWAIIGRKGAARGSVPETFDPNTASIGYLIPQAQQFGIPISVESAGTALGNNARVLVNGKQTAGSYNTGLNVIEIDENSGEVLRTKNFGTHLPAIGQYLPSQDFTHYVNALPTGRVVAIAVKGDAIAHLTESAKRACESIGSRYIRRVQVGGSWAIVGRKGAPVGTVPESASNCANALALYYLPAKSQTGKLCQISATTSGFVKDAAGNQCYLGGVSSHISVGNQVRATASRGISLAVVDEITCSISRLQAFDTHLLASASQELVSFLDGVPLGLIVVATAWDEAFRQLSENAKTALESLGSALIRNVNYRDAWAIIGRKGAARGSVPETFDPNTASIGYHAPPYFAGSTCNNSVYPLNCRAGL